MSYRSDAQFSVRSADYTQLEMEYVSGDLGYFEEYFANKVEDVKAQYGNNWKEIFLTDLTTGEPIKYLRNEFYN